LFVNRTENCRADNSFWICLDAALVFIKICHLWCSSTGSSGCCRSFWILPQAWM
jgi:hypothetical protein